MNKMDSSVARLAAEHAYYYYNVHCIVYGTVCTIDGASCATVLFA